jgi:hypothetical protein
VSFQHCFLFVLACILFFASIGLIVTLPLAETTDSRCVQKMFAWSPAFGAVEYYWKMFKDVGLVIRSPYAGPLKDPVPDEKIEKRWEALIPSKYSVVKIDNCIMTNEV